jgi:2-alkyl-3-oxoalkanoate reductase
VLLDGATFLVTGANGFVGARVAHRLAGSGVRVHALVRRAGTSQLLDSPGVTEIEGDVTDPATCLGVSSGVQAIVHCAATAGDDLAHVRHVNVGATRAILDAARAAEVLRCVHISTAAVYERGHHLLIDESVPRVTEGDPYPLTKAEAEREVETAAFAGLATTILRPPAVLGWAPTSTWGQRVPERIRDGVMPAGRPAGDTFAWVHVDDLADAVRVALEEDRAVGGVYDVVGGCVTWGEYVDEVRSWFPQAPDPVDRDAPPAWAGLIRGDRLEEELGMRPWRTFAEGMDEAAVRWVTNEGDAPH